MHLALLPRIILATYVDAAGDALHRVAGRLRGLPAGGSSGPRGPEVDEGPEFAEVSESAFEVPDPLSPEARAMRLDLQRAVVSLPVSVPEPSPLAGSVEARLAALRGGL